MLCMAHLASTLKYIELGNYTVNQLLIHFMIFHSNILNELFRGKFSHNTYNCPTICVPLIYDHKVTSTLDLIGVQLGKQS